MRSLHVRNVPEPVITALRERAARNGRSMQAEIREILETAATSSASLEPVEPLSLTTVRTRGNSTWSREEIYGDSGR